MSLGEGRDKLLGPVPSPELFDAVRDLALRLSTETALPPLSLGWGGFLASREDGLAGAAGPTASHSLPQSRQ